MKLRQEVILSNLRDGLDFKENMSKLTEKQVDEVMENIIDNILE